MQEKFQFRDCQIDIIKVKQLKVKNFEIKDISGI